MTWFRVDDDLPEHVKSDELADVCEQSPQRLAAACMAWTHLGCDCARRRTDGYFTRARAHRAVRLPPPVVDAALDDLVKAGFLDLAPGGFQFHDWADYQPTKAELDLERKAKTARQKKWRQAERAKRVSAEGGVDGAVDAPVDASTAPSTDVSTAPSPRPSTGASTDASTGASPDASRETPAPPSSVDGAPSRPVPSRPENKTDGAFPKGASSPGAAAPSAVESGKSSKPRREPTPDTIPAPNTPARAVYDALVSDGALRPITGNPGDFALRISDPATYPGVNVLAEVKRAGEWASTKPGKYTDGRAFLRNWLQRKAEDAAKAPRPAPAPVRPAAPSRPEPPRRVLTKEESIAEWKRVQQQEENAHARP